MEEVERNDVRSCFFLFSLLMCVGALDGRVKSIISYRIILAAVLLFTVFCILSYNLRYFFIRNLLQLARCVAIMGLYFLYFPY